MVLVCDGSRPVSRGSTSWAKVAVADSEQQKPSNASWPVVKQPLAPQPHVNQAGSNPLENQARELKSEVERLKTDAATLAAEVKAKSEHILKLEANLNDARKKILTLQPPQDISDDQVKQAFDDLCQNIEDLVDVECGGLTDIEDRFNIGQWTDVELRITEAHITEDDIKLSREFPKIIPNVIMNAIFSLMYMYALREDTWIALTDKRKEEEYLNEMVEIMSTRKVFYNASTEGGLQSGLKFADNPQLRRWRSEVFRALKSTGYHVSKRRSGTAEWGRKLYLMLQHFVDDGKDINIDRLRRKVIEPTFQLADMIKGSTTGYRFGFVVTSSSQDTYLEAKDANLHRLVDASTGIEEAVDVDIEGRKGKLRLCVFPSLEKVQDDGERVCMSKAVVIIDKSPDEDSSTVVADAVGAVVNGEG